MSRGIDSAASGMISILNLNDILANNLANVNTPGFKQSIPTFKDIQDIIINKTNALNNNSNNEEENNSEKLGSLSAGSVLDSTVLDFRQGSLKSTGSQLDLAINGNGFFAVETPNGEAYTRNGSFILGKNGEITTIDGYPLLGESGPIYLNIEDAEVRDFRVDTQGNIEIKGKQIDKLKIVDFENREKLQPIGNSLFQQDNNQTLIGANNYELTQGALESSNSNVIETMVNSITGMRTYEALSKVIKDNERTLVKSINEVGRMKR